MINHLSQRVRAVLFVAFFVCINSSSIMAQTNASPNWQEWNEGYEKAVKENKIILVDAYTDWCGWCKKMDRDTYAKPEIIEFIGKHFVPIKFNPEIKDRKYKIDGQEYSGEQLYNILTQGNSTGFPTTYYLYPAKKKLFFDSGYKGPADFMQVLKSAVEEDKK